MLLLMKVQAYKESKPGHSKILYKMGKNLKSCFQELTIEI